MKNIYTSAQGPEKCAKSCKTNEWRMRNVSLAFYDDDGGSRRGHAYKRRRTAFNVVSGVALTL